MSPFQDDEDLDEQKRQELYDSLRQRYAAAGNDTELQDAKAAQRRGDIASTIGEALANYGASRARSRGGNPQSFSGVFDSVRQMGARDVAAADTARKERMAQVLTDDDIGWKEKTRAREQDEWKHKDEDRKRESDARAKAEDPNSEESKEAQALAARLTGQKPEAYAGKSAAQLKTSLPTLEKLYEMDQRSKDREASAREARLARQDAQKSRDDARSDDRRWKEEQVTKANDEKKKSVLSEIEDRRTNIQSAIDTLDKMIDEYGTYEMVGSHNQDMDRLVEQIATDMAKLQDPNSVARPGEVENVKRNLISSGFGNRNSAARDILKNFREEVDRRADGAYKIRGMADLNPNRGRKTVDEKPAAADGTAYAAKMEKALPNEQDVQALQFVSDPRNKNDPDFERLRAHLIKKGLLDE